MTHILSADLDGRAHMNEGRSIGRRLTVGCDVAGGGGGGRGRIAVAFAATFDAVRHWTNCKA